MTQLDLPDWLVDRKINEALFCEAFLNDHPMKSINGTFFTVDGRVSDEIRLKKIIYDRIKPYVTSGIAKKVSNLLDVLRVECYAPGLPLYQDRIHVANGTLFLDGTSPENKDFCRNRLPVRYIPDTDPPEIWLRFLSQLLEPEDILTLQEFIGYCFIPSTKGQKMLILTGKGGEGKSRIGLVLHALLGSNMNTGRILLCEKCGARMRRNVPAKTQQTSPWYRCPTRGCNCRAIKCDYLETKVVEAMTEWLSEYSLNITPDFVPKEDPAESALARIREKLHQLHQQQDNICEYLEKGIYTVEMFTKRNDVLAKEIRKLQSQEADLTRQQALHQSTQTQAAEIIPATQQILDSYPLLSTVEKNNLWKIILEKITVFRTPSGEFSLHLYPKLPMAVK